MTLKFTQALGHVLSIETIIHKEVGYLTCDKTRLDNLTSIIGLLLRSMPDEVQIDLAEQLGYSVVDKD